MLAGKKNCSCGQIAPNAEECYNNYDYISVTKFSPAIFSPVLISKQSVVVLVVGLLVTDLVMECKYLSGLIRCESRVSH